MESLVGRTMGQYQIIEEIGVGGMASVFKAYQPGLDRYVALKILPPLYAQQPGFQERFTREAKAVAKLNHPNILPVYDYGQSGDYSYIIMRYVEAGSLQTTLGKPVELSLTVDIVSQVGMALEAAHQIGIIHRDVKPANVLLDKDDWALLTDFGLARILEESIQLTGTGVGIGTPAYMSPEQGQGGPVDIRTDIYSLGVVLFQMLTGDIPYKGDTPLSIVIKRMTEPLPIPRDINPDIPEPVERIILKSLAREPEDRFQSAVEMVERLTEAAQLRHSASRPFDVVSPVVPAIPDDIHSLGEDIPKTVPPTELPEAPDTMVRDVPMPRAPEPPTVKSPGDMETGQFPESTELPSPVSEQKRKGCPIWLIGLIGFVGIALFVFSGIMAARVLPQLVKTMRTRQAGAVSTVIPTVALISITPTPVLFDPPPTLELSVTVPRPGVLYRVERSDLPPGHGAIKGMVRDTEGKMLPDVKLEFLDPRAEDRVQAVESGPDGEYDVMLPVGRYIVAFRKGEDPRNLIPQLHDGQNYLRAVDAATVLEVTEGEELRGVDITLEHGHAVFGRLVDREGRPLEGKAGGLVSRDAGVALVGPLGVVTGRDGRFRAVVPAGKYLLTIEGPFVRKEIFPRKEVTVDGDVDLGDIVFERKLLRGDQFEAPPSLSLVLVEDEVDPSGHTEIFVSRLDGDDRRQLTHTRPPDLPAREPEYRHGGNITPAWSPDGQFVVFASNRGAADFRDHHSLYVMRADGSDPRRLTDAHPNDVWPSWAPDGEWIVYTCGCDICAIKPDGTGMRILTERSGGCDPSYVQPVWSPDSTKIAFWSESQADGPISLFVMDPHSSEMEKVAKFPADDMPGIELVWSSDGRELGWVGGKGKAFVVDVESGEIGPSSKDKVGPWSPRVHPQWLIR